MRWIKLDSGIGSLRSGRSGWRVMFLWVNLGLIMATFPQSGSIFSYRSLSCANDIALDMPDPLQQDQSESHVVPPGQ